MKVSEKALELNIGAELLSWLRGHPGLSKTYLRGLTQSEERREGADFFAQLDPRTRLFAFQFKAPKGRIDGEPYKYSIVKYQHHTLSHLASRTPGAVFYVFPYIVQPAKLHRLSPRLLADTWFLDLHGMPTAAVFGGAKTRTVTCRSGIASVNPEYRLLHGQELPLNPEGGIRPTEFAEWYSSHRSRVFDAQDSRDAFRRNPWIARGLRVAIAIP